MTQSWRDSGDRLAVDFDFSTEFSSPPSQGTVLQRRRFQYALVSGERRNGKRCVAKFCNFSL